MLEREQLVQLAKVVAKADKSAATAYSYENETFSYDELNETLRQEMNALGGTAQLFRENKNLIFSLIEEVMDDVLPAKVSAAYDRFAEVKQFGQGEKPIFRRKVNVLKALGQTTLKNKHLQEIASTDHSPVYFPCEERFQSFVQYSVRFGH